MVYNINGIATKEPPADKFWVSEFQGNFFFSKGDITPDIDFECFRLDSLLTDKMFGSYDNYNRLVHTIPYLLVVGGHDAEVNISKEDFERLISKGQGNETLNKLLYFYDCKNLLSTLQNSVVETKYLFGQFYKTLNENTFQVNDTKTIAENGIQFASGLVVTNLISTLNYLFITLYSQLDFITKVAYEFENIETEFTKYPKLKSASKLFGDRKHLKICGLSNSLFENNNTIKMITSIRNEIVHNSSYENMPKVYQSIKDGKLIEKFIYLPDFQDGVFKSFKNRKRFFSTETKMNEFLPEIVIEFWQRLKTTIDNIK